MAKREDVKERLTATGLLHCQCSESDPARPVHGISGNRMQYIVGDHGDAYYKKIYKFVAHSHGPQDVCVEDGTCKLDVDFHSWTWT